MLPNATIRKAKKEDKEPILAFCRKTFPWGDYIQYVWDWWFRSRKGGILVADVDGKPVGMCHFQMVKPKEAWLEGARVRPEYRRKGIGSQLHAKAVEHAKRLGAEVTRLAISTSNTPSIRQVDRLGYNLAGAWILFDDVYVMRLKDTSYDEATTRLASPSEEGVWEFITSSPRFGSGGRLCNKTWVFSSLARDDLAGYIRKAHAVIHKDRDVDGVALFDHMNVIGSRTGKAMRIVYLDGIAQSLPDLIGFLRNRAKTDGSRIIYFSAPKDEQIEKTCVKEGLKVEDTILVYSRNETSQS